MSTASSTLGSSGAATSRRAFHLRMILIVGIVAALEFYGRFVADATLFSPPSKIVQSFFTDIMGDARIVRALWICIVEIAVAYVLSIVFGVTTGLLVGATPFTRRAFFPVVIGRLLSWPGVCSSARCRLGVALHRCGLGSCARVWRVRLRVRLRWLRRRNRRAKGRLDRRCGVQAS